MADDEKRADVAVQLEDLALIRVPRVLELTGVSKSTLYTMMRQGRFPNSIKLPGGRVVAWRVSTIKAWLLAQGEE
jgi:prophage regulatory protein